MESDKAEEEEAGQEEGEEEEAGQEEGEEEEVRQEKGSLNSKKRCVHVEERKDESRKRKHDINRAPSALVKQRQEIMKKARTKDVGEFLEYFISETEETRRRLEKLAQEQRELKENLMKKLEEIEQAVTKSQYKPNLSQVQKAGKKVRLPWKCMADMHYALKYHQRAIKTYVDGTIPRKSTKWESAVAKSLMRKELLSRQVYSGPSSRSMDKKNPNQDGHHILTSFMNMMIRDNEEIKDKKFSLKKKKNGAECLNCH